MSDSTDRPASEDGREDRPRVDTQSLTDVGTNIYETVATLEFAGRPADLDAIAEATRVPARELAGVLQDLTARGLITSTGAPDGRVYRPARRDWSTQPGEAGGRWPS